MFLYYAWHCIEPPRWMWPPRSLTACSSLPPEGATAPVARQSRFHGPCWNGEALSCSLSLRERAGVRALRFGSTPPRSFASRNSLPPEGAAASRGPGLEGSRVDCSLRVHLQKRVRRIRLVVRRSLPRCPLAKCLHEFTRQAAARAAQRRPTLPQHHHTLA